MHISSASCYAGHTGRNEMILLSNVMSKLYYYNSYLWKIKWCSVTEQRFSIIEGVMDVPISIRSRKKWWMSHKQTGRSGAIIRDNAMATTAVHKQTTEVHEKMTATLHSIDSRGPRTNAKSIWHWQRWPIHTSSLNDLTYLEEQKRFTIPVLIVGNICCSSYFLPPSLLLPVYWSNRILLIPGTFYRNMVTVSRKPCHFKPSLIVAKTRLPIT